MSEKKPEKNVRGVSVMKFGKKIQGEPNQNLLIQVVTSLKIWIFKQCLLSQNAYTFRPYLLIVKYV